MCKEFDELRIEENISYERGSSKTYRPLTDQERGELVEVITMKQIMRELRGYGDIELPSGGKVVRRE